MDVTHQKCGHITKKGLPCANFRGRCRHHPLPATASVEGDGVRDVLSAATRPLQALPFIGKRIKFAIEGPRKVPTKRFQKFLNTVGTQPIVKMSIARKGLRSRLSQLLADHDCRREDLHGQ